MSAGKLTFLHSQAPLQTTPVEGWTYHQPRSPAPINFCFLVFIQAVGLIFYLAIFAQRLPLYPHDLVTVKGPSQWR